VCAFCLFVVVVVFSFFIGLLNEFNIVRFVLSNTVKINVPITPLHFSPTGRIKSYYCAWSPSVLKYNLTIENRHSVYIIILIYCTKHITYDDSVTSTSLWRQSYIKWFSNITMVAQYLAAFRQRYVWSISNIVQKHMYFSWRILIFGQTTG
jgi:hypothetical protein